MQKTTLFFYGFLKKSLLKKNVNYKVYGNCFFFVITFL